TAPVTTLTPAPPLSPQRKVVLVAGGPLSLVVITLATLCIVDYLSRTSYQRDFVFATSGKHLLVVRGPHDITITPSPDHNVHVHKSVMYGLARPDFVEQRTADGVTLEADCHGWMALASCSITYDVQVPPEFSLEVTSSAGTVSATGLTGA